MELLAVFFFNYAGEELKLQPVLVVLWFGRVAYSMFVANCLHFHVTSLCLNVYDKHLSLRNRCNIV